jgi:peptidoglycan/xylan/chitin deacetylase (PgdA/CDA1 family)
VDEGPDEIVISNPESGNTRDMMATRRNRLALAPSFNPPLNAPLSERPLFVLLTFDDNDRIAGALDWVLETLGDHRDSTGEPVHFSFMVMGKALDRGSFDPAASLASVYRQARDAGHEIGNHSYDHIQNSLLDVNFETIDGNLLSLDDWRRQLHSTHSIILDKCSFTDDDVVGWRTPRIEYTDDTIRAVHESGYLYDSSLTISAGTNGSTDVTWPYTLDDGQAPSTCDINPFGARVGSYPGLWELPINMLKRRGQSDFIGVDYNAFHAPEGDMSGSEFTDMLLHNLKLRLEGNRAPLQAVGHTGLLNPCFDNSPHWPTRTNFEERRAAFKDFVTEAVKMKDVRFVTQHELVKWLQRALC